MFQSVTVLSSFATSVLITGLVSLELRTYNVVRQLLHVHAPYTSSCAGLLEFSPRSGAPTSAATWKKAVPSVHCIHVRVQVSIIIRDNSGPGPRKSALRYKNSSDSRKSALPHCTLKLSRAAPRPVKVLFRPEFLARIKIGTGTCNRLSSGHVSPLFSCISLSPFTLTLCAFHR